MPATQRGQADKLVRFERPALEQEAMGGTRPAGWALVEEAWAKVTFGPSAERREAGALGASQVATFRVLGTSNLRTATDEWRIVWNGNWNVRGAVPVNGRAEIEFTAVLAKG